MSVPDVFDGYVKSAMSFAERREQREWKKNAVVISFESNVDQEELTDDDLRDLGLFVVEVTKDVRARKEEGLL